MDFLDAINRGGCAKIVSNFEKFVYATWRNIFCWMKIFVLSRSYEKPLTPCLETIPPLCLCVVDWLSVREDCKSFPYHLFHAIRTYSDSLNSIDVFFLDSTWMNTNRNATLFLVEFKHSNNNYKIVTRIDFSCATQFEDVFLSQKGINTPTLSSV